MPSRGAGLLPAQGGGRGPAANGGEQERELQSGFVCAATPELLARNAQSPRCLRIRTALLRERNVCYASSAPCPPAAPATVLFVAASAQEDLLRARNSSKQISALHRDAGDSAVPDPFTYVLSAPLLIGPIPVMNFAPPSRHPHNLPTNTLTSPTLNAHAI